MDFVIRIRSLLDTERSLPIDFSSSFSRYSDHSFRSTMGKQRRSIAQKVKVKQQQQIQKAKAVKTNLKRVRSNAGQPVRPRLS